MKLLDDFTEAQKAVHDYFGYVEDWVAIPLEDSTKYYWKLDMNQNGGGEVMFGEKFEDVDEETGNHYQDTIYTQRFLPKWVYRGEDYTMVSCDTHTDGNKFLRIFDNTLEIT